MVTASGRCPLLFAKALIITASIIDLSLPLENDRRWSPWWARTSVKYQGHRFGTRVLRWLFGVPASLLETGQGWANENLSLSTHGTTHVDAPWHYGPECEGRPARTIDEMPLDWFVGPVVILDMRHRVDECQWVTGNDVENALTRIEHELQPGDIVLIWTGCDQLWGTRDYFRSGPCMTVEATELLIDHEVRLMGIDAWGWDGPLDVQARRARSAHQRGVFWAAHYLGTRREYCHMERLANLDQLPATGATLCGFPLKVRGGSAGPARVVAFVGTQHFPYSVG